MEKKSDLWETPQELFDELNNEFNFDVDLCCNLGNSKVYEFFQDYLINLMYWRSYTNETFEELVDYYAFKCAFMNPPYSNPKPFIEKAYEDSKYCKIVCLIKCDPSTKTWAVFWDYEKNQPKPGVEVRFLPKRVKFVHPEDGKKCAAPFPSTIVIMDRRDINGKDN